MASPSVTLASEPTYEAVQYTVFSPISLTHESAAVVVVVVVEVKVKFILK